MQLKFDKLAVDLASKQTCSLFVLFAGEASLDSSSPDFLPTVFQYTKQSQNPEANLER